MDNMNARGSNRRDFLGVAALAVVSARLPVIRAVAPEATRVDDSALRTPGPTEPLGPVKQIDAGDLNVGYVEVGPATGRVVVLLHGWPYDIHSYENVAPLLAAKGYRVIVPYLRGYGSTRFRSNATVRNGQQAAVGADTVALMDALKIDRAILAGFDWGSRTAGIVGALWPKRCRGLVAVSGYLITNLAANKQPLPPAAELGWWYQYYFATERGRAGYDKNRRDFNKLIWHTASPKWNFDDATFDRTAPAFDNPDHVAIVIHNYRWRLGLANGETKYDDLENKLQTSPVIAVPTVTIGSDFDGANADGKASRDKFTGKYAHVTLAGIGHNVPQEAPQAFADAVVQVDGFSPA
jgi:pimeloyl-ACP methyl ester carboxylesterase